jgi:solute carrier family 8 (sodium/calcium exchanger)
MVRCVDISSANCRTFKLNGPALGLLTLSVLLTSTRADDAAETEVIEIEPSYEICKKGGKGLFLPAGGWAEDGNPEDYEGFPQYFMSVAYFFGLIWLFMAVGIIADIFMDAIEEITSAEKEYAMKDGSRKVFKVWNPTVANLTLMALGSSAPEILLSVLEILNNSFYAGDLGPSTIVGSAAFNLFVIIAVCVIAIPAGPDPENPDGRKIADLNVFTVTGFFSVFAYVWLLFILMVTGSQMCSFVEGLITFLLFPILVSLAYAADKGLFSKRPDLQAKIIPGEVNEKGIIADELVPLSTELTQDRAAELLAKLNTSDLSPKEAAALVRDLNLKSKGPPSRALLRRQAIRQLCGGKRVVAKRAAPGLVKKYQKGDSKPTVFFGDEAGNITTKYGVLENDGVAKLTVCRIPAKSEMTIEYETADIAGEAEAGADYKSKKGTLKFKKGEETQVIEIEILNDDEVEKDERFLVKLSKCSDATVDMGPSGEVAAEVTIIDDDEPGEIGMAATTDEEVVVIAKEGTERATVVVRRFNGSKGKIECSYATSQAKSVKDGETIAIMNADFTPVSGSLVFEATEMEKEITIPVIDSKSQDEKRAAFMVTIKDVKGPVAERSCTTGNLSAKVVVVSEHENNKAIIAEVMKMNEADEEKFNGEPTTWMGQFSEAFEMELEDDQETADTFTFVMHWITVPWKLLFATCPPAHYYGGIPCFFWSLSYVGLVTGFIGDLASLFGCSLGMPDSTTAITFVALGTSLPDTFASKTAAESDDTADAAVGNVTGSNAVNVFLGIGLPWMIAAARWEFGDVDEKETAKWAGKYKDNKILMKAYEDNNFEVPGFAVETGSLGGSVALFSFCACCCFALLVYRRKTYGMELGGPEEPAKKHAIFLVCLWLTYVVGSIILAD